MRADLNTDWTGNGTDSPGMYRPSTQSFYLVSDEMCNCSLYSDYNFQLSHGSNNYPVAGDWLGDGYSSIGLYNTNNPYSFIIRKAIGDSTINYNLGPLPSAQPGDLPVAGHWLAVCAQLPNRIQSGRIPTCAQATVAPGTCPITINALNYFRIAPALDDRSTIDPNGENWLFSINAGNSVAFPTTARPWLWAFNPVTNGQVPTSLTIQSINAINATGRIGIIPWIDKNTQWVQAQITASLLLPASGNIAQTTTLTGYLELTDKNNAILASPANSGCLAALPFSPPDAPIPNSVALTAIPSPIVTLASTFFLTPPVATAAPFGISTPGTSTDLNSGLPSSVMGTFMFHNGNLEGGVTTSCAIDQQNCTGLTLDLVPGNQEFCLDNRSANLLSQCDPNPQNVITQSLRIPVYAPLAGCVFYAGYSVTIEVNQACNNRQPSRLQIILTHIKNPITGATSNGAQVNAGDKIAEFCTRQDWTSGTCSLPGKYQADAPVHVAFQLRVYVPGNQFVWPVPPAYLLFLAHPSCLYDRWMGNNGSTPNPQLNSITQSCP